MLRNGLRSPLDRFLLNEGEGGEGEGGSGGSGGNSGEGKPPEQEKTVPQSRVDEIVSGRVSDTKKQTEERIAKELGVPISEAKALIAAALKKVDDEKSDTQREKEAATKAREEADAERALAAKERREASIERALVRAGVEDEKISRATRVLDLAEDADAAAIKKAVDELKSDEPTWFGEETGTNGKKPPLAPGSDPKGKPPAKKQTDTAYDRGVERAKATAGSTGYKLPGM